MGHADGTLVAQTAGTFAVFSSGEVQIERPTSDTGRRSCPGERVSDGGTHLQRA